MGHSQPPSPFEAAASIRPDKPSEVSVPPGLEPSEPISIVGAAAARPVRVLIVEDDQHIAEMICLALEHMSKNQQGTERQYKMTTAFDGQAALDLLKAELFDALITDINLPGVDGPMMIEQIRADERLAELPILAVSAGGSAARTRALEAGADLFMEKPMRMKVVMVTMEQLLKR